MISFLGITPLNSVVNNSNSFQFPVLYIAQHVKFPRILLGTPSCPTEVQFCIAMKSEHPRGVSPESKAPTCLAFMARLRKRLDAIIGVDWTSSKNIPMTGFFAVVAMFWFFKLTRFGIEK